MVADRCTHPDFFGASVTIGTLQVNVATPVVTWPHPAAITYPAPLSSTELDATASVPGTFVYTPPEGTVLNAGPGQPLSVAFTPTDTANYVAVTQTTTLTVRQEVSVVTWPTPAAIPYGTALSATQLSATASVPGTFVYTPAAGTVLGGGVRTLSVRFTPTDTANYAVTTVTVQITVLPATPVITWNTPANIVYGTALKAATQLNATASAGGSFAYNPPAGTVLDVGSYTLTVTFTPADATNYTTATKTTTITVRQVTSVITWARPAAITYPTPLSSTQLNATASGPGTFDYTPPEGTVLDVGTGQALAVTFTPTDTTDYTTATKTVTINVQP
jgi:hypothetical protein